MIREKGRKRTNGNGKRQTIREKAPSLFIGPTPQPHEGRAATAGGVYTPRTCATDRWAMVGLRGRSACTGGYCAAMIIDWLHPHAHVGYRATDGNALGLFDCHWRRGQQPILFPFPSPFHFFSVK